MNSMGDTYVMHHLCEHILSDVSGYYVCELRCAQREIPTFCTTCVSISCLMSVATGFCKFCLQIACPVSGCLLICARCGMLCFENMIVDVCLA